MWKHLHIFSLDINGFVYHTSMNSNAGKVTTNTHSQGIRFLTEVTGLRSQDFFLKLIVIPWDFLYEIMLSFNCRENEFKRYK